MALTTLEYSSTAVPRTLTRSRGQANDRRKNIIFTRLFPLKDCSSKQLLDLQLLSVVGFHSGDELVACGTHLMHRPLSF